MSPKTRGVKRDPQPVIKRKIKKIKIDFMSNKSEDNVIKDLRNYYKSKPIDQQISINHAILDHIALEGLEGITLKRLFNILDAIYSNFNLMNDENCQDYIWSILVSNHIIQPNDAGVKAFYNVQKSRQSDTEELKKNVIMDKPMKLPQQTSKRFNIEGCNVLYPVQDGLVMGSCSNYLTRQDITRELIEVFEEEGARASLCHLHEKYNINNIFFVASQTIRSKCIYPSYADPNMKIMLREYCTLELIGKSRTLGCVFPNNKTFGRYRIMLEKKKFITEYQATASHPIEHHLRKFSFVRKSPGFLQQQFRENSLRNQSQSNKMIELEDDDDNFPENNKSGDDDFDEEDDDDEELNIRSKDSKLLLARLCCNPPMMKPYRSILSTMYSKIAISENGLTQLDLRRVLHLPKYQVRNHLKNLISLKMIWSGPISPENPFRRYKPAYKSKRKKKKRSLKTGIMAKWDEKDMKAKRFLGQKRSSFSKAEDSLLILCRIASVLINPESNLSWSVHKRVVRNVLHRELIESHDKTSDACLRRIKYLRKLPNSIRSIDELVAGLRVDHEIEQLLSTKKMHIKDKRKTERNLRRLFLNLLKIIKTKVPNLLGISPDESNSTGSLMLSGTASETLAIEWPKIQEEIASYDELIKKYDLVDCQMNSMNTVAPSYHHQKYHSSSLIRLARGIDRNYSINIDENNEMPSFALLTSIFTYFSTLQETINLELTLRVPTNIVGIDQGNENFKSLCEKASDSTKEILERFLRRCDNPKAAVSSLKDTSDKNISTSWSNSKATTTIQSNQSATANVMTSVGVRTRRAAKEAAATATPFLVDPVPSNEISPTLTTMNTVTTNDASKLKTDSYSDSSNMKIDDSRRALFLLRHELKTQALDKCGSLSDCLVVQPCSVRFHSQRQLMLDGEVIATELFSNKYKLIESLLSWIIVFPGIEQCLLEREFDKNLSVEQFRESLNYMLDLNLIIKQKTKRQLIGARLFGCPSFDYLSKDDDLGYVITYEAKADAYVKYCQLISTLST